MMTANEIIKALECCNNGECSGCPISFDSCCITRSREEAINIINRQKTEIEGYKHYYNECLTDLKNAHKEIEKLQNRCEDCAGCTQWKCDCSLIEGEAIKEFAKELAERFKQREDEKACSWCRHSTIRGCRSRECDMDNGYGRVRCFFYDQWESCVDNIINNLVKEMVIDRSEIDSLKEVGDLMSEHPEEITSMNIKIERQEAVKEFAERLKALKIKPEFPWDDFYVTETAIDNLVKEMTGEK